MTVQFFDPIHCATTPPVHVFKAIQKECGGPWIALFLDTDRITWSVPDEP